MWQYIGVSVIITVCVLPYEFSHCKILVMSFMFFRDQKAHVSRKLTTLFSILKIRLPLCNWWVSQQQRRVECMLL